MLHLLGGLEFFIFKGEECFWFDLWHFTFPAITLPHFSKGEFPKSNTANKQREAGTGLQR